MIKKVTRVVSGGQRWLLEEEEGERENEHEPEGEKVFTFWKRRYPAN